MPRVHNFRNSELENATALNILKGEEKELSFKNTFVSVTAIPMAYNKIHKSIQYIFYCIHHLREFKS